MTCPICLRRPVRGGYGTCADSHCQEASYYLNKARNTRRVQAKPAAYALASAKVLQAEHRFDREFQQLEIDRDQAAEEAKMRAEMGG